MTRCIKNTQLQNKLTYMDTLQIANFTYWLMETTDNRGTINLIGHEKIVAINKLIPIFLKKYPTGILTGFVDTIVDKNKYALAG